MRKPTKAQLAALGRLFDHGQGLIPHHGTTRVMIERLDGYGWIDGMRMKGAPIDDEPHHYELTELGENALAGRTPT